jgi:hypothetical protein
MIPKTKTIPASIIAAFLSFAISIQTNPPKTAARKLRIIVSIIHVKLTWKDSGSKVPSVPSIKYKSVYDINTKAVIAIYPTITPNNLRVILPSGIYYE